MTLLEDNPMTSSGMFNQTVNESREAILVIILAISAAILIKIPELFGVHLAENEGFYIRNFSFFVLPLLTGYFAWKRKVEIRMLTRLAVTYASAMAIINIYPFESNGHTEILAALHLPIALWLIVGISHAGGRWSETDRRMDFIRFSGELFIIYVLIGLGGMVLTGFMALIFQTIQIDIEPFFESWILPCGIAGAVIIASWLAESQKGITENIASMLAKLFSPLFAIVLITFLGTLLFSGRSLDIERDLLIAFNMLLVISLGLLLYSVSARKSDSSPGVFDIIQAVLLISALIADLIALWSISGRIAEFGVSPNRLVVLGMNLILLVNLSWSAVLYIRLLRGKSHFGAIKKWQTDYLPVYAGWAWLVVVVIPPFFGYS